jgi:hypothetical protein
MRTLEFEQMPGVAIEVTEFEAVVVEVPGFPSPPAPPVAEPQTILHLNQAWEIHANWQQIGVACMLVGTWHLDAYLESIGPGPEIALGQVVAPFACGAIVAPPLVIPAGTPAQAGAYKLVLTLTALQGDGVNPFQMAGYMEGPILQFYP